MSDESPDEYSMDLRYPVYVRTPGSASTVAEEREWYNEAERQWDSYHNLLGPKDKKEWYHLVPYLKFTQASARKFSNHVVGRVSIENMTWAHVAMARILWGTDQFLASKMGQKALQKYPMANLRELPPNMNGPTPSPSDVSMMDVDASNVSSNSTTTLSGSGDTKIGIIEASAPVNPFNQFDFNKLNVPATQPVRQTTLFETRTFDLKSPTKFNPGAAPTPNATQLARPRNFAQLQKYTSRVRGVNEEVKQLKSEVDAIKGQVGGLGSKYDKDVESCKSDVASLQGRLDDLEGVVADLVEKLQQGEEGLEVVKEWILLFREHLGVE